MNWLRDNILKILIILGVLVIAAIIVAVIFKPQQDNIVKGSKYGELETKLQNAAIKYVKNHKKLLPTTTDKITKIKLSTLQSNNYIGKLVAIDDPTYVCDGYVDISKIDEEKNDYRYTPYLTCGKYYITKTIGDYIIDTETDDGTFNRTVDDGLYKMGDEYIFRGEQVNNYLKLDEHLYRIIKIDSNNQLKLISVNRTGNKQRWDDRYNVEKDKSLGINNFVKSRLHEGLENLYNPESRDVFFTTKEMDYIVENNFCIGKRNTMDTNIYSGAECKETTPLKVGLITVDEYAKASIDPNCKTIFDKSCANYNYFNSLGTNSLYTYFTLTAVEDNTYQFYKIRYTVSVAKAYEASPLYPVIFINNKTIYASGTGTATDPYIVR